MSMRNPAGADDDNPIRFVRVGKLFILGCNSDEHLFVAWI